MSEATSVEGGCLCGALRFSIDLPTAWCVHCHCSMCRRSHGAGFVTWIGVPHERFRMLAGEESLRRFSSSEHGTRSFCGKCGSSLFCELDEAPNEIDIVLANLDGPIDRRPEWHIYFDHRAQWVEVQDGLPRLGGESGIEPLPDENVSKRPAS